MFDFLIIDNAIILILSIKINILNLLIIIVNSKNNLFYNVYNLKYTIKKKMNKYSNFNNLFDNITK